MYVLLLLSYDLTISMYTYLFGYHPSTIPDILNKKENEIEKNTLQTMNICMHMCVFTCIHKILSSILFQINKNSNKNKNKQQQLQQNRSISYCECETRLLEHILNFKCNVISTLNIQ